MSELQKNFSEFSEKQLKHIERQMKALRKQKRLIRKGLIHFVIVYGVCAFGLLFSALFIALTWNQKLFHNSSESPEWLIFLMTRFKMIGFSLMGGAVFGIKMWFTFLRIHEMTKANLRNLIGETATDQFIDTLENQP